MDGHSIAKGRRDEGIFDREGTKGRRSDRLTHFLIEIRVSKLSEKRKKFDEGTKDEGSVHCSRLRLI